ncbi:zinc ribbon domain-containing protein [Candidatus Bathyarchaeota archaeon]|nr:zinc ribbon domain-containing protein [Candidatus Bathyarchaeota archaeon]
MIGNSRSGRVNLIATLTTLTGVVGMMSGMVLLILTPLLSLLQFDWFGYYPSNGVMVTFGLLLGFVLMVLGILWLVAGTKLVKGYRRGPNWSMADIVLSITGAIAAAGLGFWWGAVVLILWNIALLYVTGASVIGVSSQAGATGSLSGPTTQLTPQVARLETLLETARNVGTPVARKCQNCGAMVRAGAVVCDFCGEPA